MSETKWNNATGLPEAALDKAACVRLLARHNLYVFESEEDIGHDVIYAPLADSAFLVDATDLWGLVRVLLSPDEADEEYLQTLHQLTEVPTVSERAGYIRDERDFINLSILPNNICNFSCTYCYSAKGRSSARLPLFKAKAAVDFFLHEGHRPQPLLTVSIFGGGEPLLSWSDVVAPLIEYVHQSTDRCRQRVVVTLITNGSLVSEDLIQKCLYYHLDLVVSYDLLEEVQNAQRRHFAEVTANLRRLIDRGIVPAINAVVTDLNVGRQDEMVQVLHDRFPEIRHAAFEPVIGEVSDRRAFYARFLSGFIAALHLAEQYGIRLTCTVLRNVDVTVDRYCPGELALCPDGSLSICPCVSSPQEPRYADYIYGRVDDDGTVHINRQKLKRLLGMNVNSQAWCADCFAKWNCGGGCLNTTLTNGNKPDADYCRFVRQSIRYFITHRLDRAYQEEYGESIKKYIGDYERFVREEYL